MTRSVDSPPDYLHIIEKLLEDMERIRRAMEPLPGNVAKDVAIVACTAIAEAKEALGR